MTANTRRHDHEGDRVLILVWNVLAFPFPSFQKPANENQRMPPIGLCRPAQSSAARRCCFLRCTGLRSLARRKGSCCCAHPVGTFRFFFVGRLSCFLLLRSRTSPPASGSSGACGASAPPPRGVRSIRSSSWTGSKLWSCAPFWRSLICIFSDM